MQPLRAFLAALEHFVLAQGHQSKLFVLQDLTIQAPKQPSVCCAPPAPTSLQLDMLGHRAQIVRLELISPTAQLQFVFFAMLGRTVLARGLL